MHLLSKKSLYPITATQHFSGKIFVYGYKKLIKKHFIVKPIQSLFSSEFKTPGNQFLIVTFT